MSAARARNLVNSWETVRYELLNSRVCDIRLDVEGSPMEPYIQRLYRELGDRGLEFRPEVYPTDSWGCPDEVPIIGVPFYLMDRRLARIEEEQTGEIENGAMIMMLLRHEAGHALNYAHRLHKDPEWVEMFGLFSRPYRDKFRPNPFSRNFVRHITHHQYGRTYAQKHPDEDFAETFAVWLTPRSGWRRRYRTWPALRKLKFVDRRMKALRGFDPIRTTGRLDVHVEDMDILLAEHYGQRAERYRAAAQGYVDDKLHGVFPEVRSRALVPAADLFKRHGTALVERVTQWSELDEEEVRTLLAKLQDRADALSLYFPSREESAKILDVTALATAIAINFAYTGRLTG